MRFLRIFFLVAGLALVQLVFFNVDPTQAISSVGPDENDFAPNTLNNDFKFEVARYCVPGCGGALEAPESTVVIYYPTSTGTAYIDGGHQFCAGDTLSNNARTIFEIYRGGDPNPGALVWAGDSQYMNCGLYPVTIGGLPAIIIGGATFYALTVRAVHQTTVGLNAFEIQGGGGTIVSYYNASGDFFTIQDKAAANPSNFYGDFNLKFGSDCSITGPTQVTLRWFDDDHRDAPGAGSNWNQTAADNYRMELYRTPKSGGSRVRIAYLEYNGASSGFTSLSNGGYGWTGDNRSGWANFIAHPDMQYEWIWYNVKRTNGVSFQVPFNSIYYLYGCGSFDYRASIGLDRSTARPGDTIVATHTNTNVGSITGPEWLRAIHVSAGSPYVTRVTSWGNDSGNTAQQNNVPGIGPGSVSRAANYQVNNSAPHGSTVCFYARVATSSPSTSHSSAPRCVTIYNLRFDLSATVTLPPKAAPGETINISYFVCNNDDQNGVFSPSGSASRGNSVPTDITSSGDLNPNINLSGQTIAPNGCLPNPATYQVTVPPSAVVGDSLCATISANRNYGFSDGAGLGGGSASDTECLVITDGPYLQVLGHDTWSGGNYSLNGSCAATGSGDIKSLTADNLVSPGTVGAYDQYAAFARGSVSGFGTANSAGGNNLTFANTPTNGLFGALRCLANLFDTGGAGGNIDDALWNNSLSTLPDLNGLSGVADGQYRIDGSTSHNNNGAPLNNFSGNLTILVRDNLEIRNDIVFNPNGLSPGNIPLIVFIVGGDILIEHDVTRMDGIYIAFGSIDTCSTGAGSLSPQTSLTSGAPCNRHLEVNGSLIANDIAFRRTHGGTNEAATGNNLGRCRTASSPFYADINRRCAAETIIFHPWLYLADPFFDRGGGAAANRYPIQQIRDLPPIF